MPGGDWLELVNLVLNFSSPIAQTICGPGPGARDITSAKVDAKTKSPWMNKSFKNLQIQSSLRCGYLYATQMTVLEKMKHLPHHIWKWLEEHGKDINMIQSKSILATSEAIEIDCLENGQ